MKMNKTLPKAVKLAWENKKAEAIFTTVSEDSIANSIYVTCTSLYDGNKIIVANNFFDKTMTNILAGSKGSILFITKDDKPKAYQIKGSIEYITKGNAFDNMKEWNPKHLPGHGAAVITIEEIYSGAEKIQ
ncbi:pyridoxamine 5'-phosphate oxidase family protein [Labilibaculum sp.]|uniref:pyridoxamine 5'-phosphate oxidase family protein n=1 Tax=Labilibaculum sp. TaxID=2060723 RepID=UPI003565DCC1